MRELGFKAEFQHLTKGVAESTLLTLMCKMGRTAVPISVLKTERENVVRG